MHFNNTQPQQSPLLPSARTQPPQADPLSRQPDRATVGLAYIQTVVQTVQEKIAPVWPLNDYVAVNPYLGFSSEKILATRQSLRKLSDLELLMPLDYYRQQYEQGTLQTEDIDAAIDELVADGVAGAEQLGRNHIVSLLQSRNSGASTQTSIGETISSGSESSDHILRTYAEMLDRTTGSQWNRRILDEISKHCATHYDEGQAFWSSPWQQLPLYQAWRAAAHYDRNFEVLGVSGFRQFVSRLPQDPFSALVELLNQLNVPHTLWTEFLLCESLAMPGWSAWVRYRQQQAQPQGEEIADFPALLAMRLAYEAALVEETDFHVNWVSYAARWSRSLTQSSADDLPRYTLLKASEIAFRKQLLGGIDSRKDEQSTLSQSDTRQLAQMVFCIDVRSERIRRHLEAESRHIETFGFAGFFGLPIEFVPLGEEEGIAQVPALASPQFKVYERVSDVDSTKNDAAVKKRSLIRFLRKAWKEFQTSAVSCFSFVEATGLLYAFHLIRRSFGWGGSVNSRSDGLSSADQHRLAPSMLKLNEQGVDLERQTEMAESVLRGIGITDDFARLVVLCGHGCKTENNPLQAGLECGACGGHSGEVNARFAAKLLNQKELRESLKRRGIDIPDDTYFLPGLHNTTTDDIEFLDTHQVPASHSGDLSELQEFTRTASFRTRCERLPLLPGPSIDDLIRRSRDWSETRPEWGLAGNAAFIAAPRSFTSSASLEGRSFLHSYDYRNDPDFQVLEQIMTAPLVVAHWINMQYYASTVDSDYFSSGNKTIHNVVGQFGILSGNGGDLMTGLPIQSVHDGNEYRHQPLRLLGVLAAPRHAIEAIITRHKLLENLLTNGWLQLIAIDDEVHYRFTERQTWDELSSPSSSLAFC